MDILSSTANASGAQEISQVMRELHGRDPMENRLTSAVETVFEHQYRTDQTIPPLFPPRALNEQDVEAAYQLWEPYLLTVGDDIDRRLNRIKHRSARTMPLFISEIAAVNPYLARASIRLLDDELTSGNSTEYGRTMEALCSTYTNVYQALDFLGKAVLSTSEPTEDELLARAFLGDIRNQIHWSLAETAMLATYIHIDTRSSGEPFTRLYYYRREQGFPVAVFPADIEAYAKVLDEYWTEFNSGIRKDVDVCDRRATEDHFFKLQTRDGKGCFIRPTRRPAQQARINFNSPDAGGLSFRVDRSNGTLTFDFGTAHFNNGSWIYNPRKHRVIPLAELVSSGVLLISELQGLLTNIGTRYSYNVSGFPTPEEFSEHHNAYIFGAENGESRGYQGKKYFENFTVILCLLCDRFHTKFEKNGQQQTSIGRRDK